MTDQDEADKKRETQERAKERKRLKEKIKEHVERVRVLDEDKKREKPLKRRSISVARPSARANELGSR
ncbi:MAG: hypothetical protein AB1540_06625 [Bdellovibrionota bacterium]